MKYDPYTNKQIGFLRSIEIHPAIEGPYKPRRRWKDRVPLIIDCVGTAIGFGLTVAVLKYFGVWGTWGL